MSETTEATGTADATAPAAGKALAKPKVEKVTVEMTDGRKVDFPISRKVDKTIIFDAAGTAIGVRFDYINGATRTFLRSEIPAATDAYSSCHGLAQKVGDSTAGAKDKELTVEDIVLTHDDLWERLTKGEWNVEKGTGDSLAGATIVIKALVEVTSKDAAWVKAYLEKMLEDGKAGGLTRQKMYNSFRDPKSKVGQVIRRLEEEKAAANAAFNADDLAAQMMAAAA